jgi:hypothetical protein
VSGALGYRWKGRTFFPKLRDCVSVWKCLACSVLREDNVL